MSGLLDFIFTTLDIESLEQQKVMEYLCYLQEIDLQLRSREDRIKFIGHRIKLVQRLLDIDHKIYDDLQRELAQDY